jgi:hypothetical protein
MWTKLGLIVVVPTAVALAVSTNALLGERETQRAAEQASDLAALSQSAGQLVHALQDERAAAVIRLAPDPKTASPLATVKAAYVAAYPAVDSARGPYSRQRTALSGLPATMAEQLDVIDAQLDGLPGLRGQVTAGSTAISEAAGAYQVLIAGLIDIRESAARQAGGDLGQRMRAAAEVTRVKDAMAQQRVVVHQMFGQKEFAPALRTEFLRTMTLVAQAAGDFLDAATPAEQALYQSSVDSTQMRKVDVYVGYLLGRHAKDSSDIGGITFTASQWDTAMSDLTDQVREVEANVDRATVAGAEALRDEAGQDVLVQIGLLSGLLLLVAVLCWLTVRDIRRLRGPDDGGPAGDDAGSTPPAPTGEPVGAQAAGGAPA